jgi:renal tumor antigen
VNNLREIQALRRLSPHPHIIKLLEVLYDQPTGRLALVFELMVRAVCCVLCAVC